MKLAVFLNGLGLGGTEKAACRWACGLQTRGHQVTVLSLADGPRRADLEQRHVPLKIVPSRAGDIAAVLRELAPEVIHAHAENFLPEALTSLPQKIPVVFTNVFGRLPAGRAPQWINKQLFISWTSCVQAARRSWRKLDDDFFRNASVAVYPLDPAAPAAPADIAAFRQKIGVSENVILFGRLSRPEPNKWTNLALDAFRLAGRSNRNLKLLLREPPPLIAAQLRAAPDAGQFVILPATSAAEELLLTLSALDVVLHTSSIGESFGYGIAEPMSLGRPVITHSVPWQDQAQIELVRHGECGCIASTPATMAVAMLKLANDRALRQSLGQQARQHIRTLAAPETSLGRLEIILQAASERRPNPLADGDLARARETAAYLDTQQFGHTWREQLALCPLYYRVRFHEFRKRFH